jgi:hypothetical protein
VSTVEVVDTGGESRLMYSGGEVVLRWYPGLEDDDCVDGWTLVD